jgi:hypothetical protein
LKSLIKSCVSDAGRPLKNSELSLYLFKSLRYC